MLRMQQHISRINMLNGAASYKWIVNGLKGGVSDVCEIKKKTREEKQKLGSPMCCATTELPDTAVKMSD